MNSLLSSSAIKSEAMNKISVKFYCCLASLIHVHLRAYTRTMFLTPIIYVSRRRKNASSPPKRKWKTEIQGGDFFSST